MRSLESFNQDIKLRKNFMGLLSLFTLIFIILSNLIFKDKIMTKENMIDHMSGFSTGFILVCGFYFYKLQRP